MTDTPLTHTRVCNTHSHIDVYHIDKVVGLDSNSLLILGLYLHINCIDNGSRHTGPVVQLSATLAQVWRRTYPGVLSQQGRCSPPPHARPRTDARLASRFWSFSFCHLSKRSATPSLWHTSTLRIGLCWSHDFVSNVCKDTLDRVIPMVGPASGRLLASKSLCKRCSCVHSLSFSAITAR